MQKFMGKLVDVVALLLLPLALVKFTLEYWWEWFSTGEKPK
jgi:hypothetical protein